MKIEVPNVELDLYYNSGGDHLLLSVLALKTDVILRYFDMRVFCQYSSLRIEDSVRVSSQKTLLRNDLAHEAETQITYFTINNKKSPLYKSHSTEIGVNFNELTVNADVITLQHLQPFIHVLLGKSNGSVPIPPPVPFVDEVAIRKTNNASDLDATNTTPRGMLIVLDFKTVHLNLFRVFSDELHLGEDRELEMTYSIHAEALMASISMRELMRADVGINKFHVVDSREASGDYVFKTIFCPLVFNEEGSPSIPELQRVGHNQTAAAVDTQTNLLTVIYEQESSDVACVHVVLRDIFSLVSLDILLDLIDVSVSNAFAVLALLVAPMPLLQPRPPEDRYSPDDPPSETGTINVIVNASNLTVVLLDDPATDTSQAIAVSVGEVEVHYHRDTAVSSFHRAIKESLVRFFYYYFSFCT